jgi:hypothetical protein
MHNPYSLPNVSKCIHGNILGEGCNMTLEVEMKNELRVMVGKLKRPVLYGRDLK